METFDSNFGFQNVRGNVRLEILNFTEVTSVTKVQRYEKTTLPFKKSWHSFKMNLARFQSSKIYANGKS